MGLLDLKTACVQLEYEIKTELGLQQYGDRLAESFINKLRSTKNYLESDIRMFRQELRGLFKLIRNEYMHNLVDADVIVACAILFRIARVRSRLGESRSSSKA